MVEDDWVPIIWLILFEKKDYVRIVGHCQIPDDIQYLAGNVLYVGIKKALQLQSLGKVVEVHWESTEEDELALAEYQTYTQLYRTKDPLSNLDGWTR